jgi:hypothetical protein
MAHSEREGIYTNFRKISELHHRATDRIDTTERTMEEENNQAPVPQVLHSTSAKRYHQKFQPSSYQGLDVGSGNETSNDDEDTAVNKEANRHQEEGTDGRLQEAGPLNAQSGGQDRRSQNPSGPAQKTDPQPFARHESEAEYITDETTLRSKQTGELEFIDHEPPSTSSGSSILEINNPPHGVNEHPHYELPMMPNRIAADEVYERNRESTSPGASGLLYTMAVYLVVSIISTPDPLIRAKFDGTLNGMSIHITNRTLKCPFPIQIAQTARRFSDIDKTFKILPMDVVPKHSLDQGSRMSKMFDSAQLHKHDTVTTTILTPVHIADFTKPVCQRKPRLNTINSNHHFNRRYSARAVLNGTSPQ